MSHYCTAVFHEVDTNVVGLMRQYDYDTEDEDLLKFTMDYTKAGAKKEFKNHCKAHPEDVKMNMDDFMQEYCSCYHKDEDGSYGNKSNPNGLYDWFEIGGRWEKILHSKVTKEIMKNKQDVALKDKSKYELKEYIELRMLSPKKYCERTNCLGKTTIALDKFDVKSTIEMNRNWAGPNCKIQDLFYTVICQEDGIKDTSDLNDLIEYWKKKGGYLTVVDYHS